MTRFWRISALTGATLVVLFDEWVKNRALRTLPLEEELVRPGFLAFAIHKNPGIAFDIPFKMPLIVVVSLVIGAFLLHLAWKNREKRPNASLFALMVVVGAAGNLFDRVVYGFTVDYILLFGRLAINLCDIVIVGGVIGLLLSGSKDASRDRI